MIINKLMRQPMIDGVNALVASQGMDIEDDEVLDGAIRAVELFLCGEAGVLDHGLLHDDFRKAEPYYAISDRSQEECVIPVEEVLEASRKNNLNEILIIGTDQDGTLYAASSHGIKVASHLIEKFRCWVDDPQ